MGRARRQKIQAAEPATGRGAWPPELEDLQRRGGMAPDWHEATHGLGGGVGSMERLFSPVFAECSQETHEALRSRRLRTAETFEIISKVSVPDLENLDKSDPFVHSLWLQEKMRTQEVLSSIGVEIDLPGLEDQWKENFVKEVKEHFVTFGARLLSYPLLARLLPTNRALHSWVKKEKREEVHDALERFAASHPHQFQDLVRYEISPVLYQALVFQGYRTPAFGEQVFRHIVRCSFPSLEASPLEDFDNLGIDWNEDEKNIFMSSYLHDISRLTVQEDIYPDGNATEEDWIQTRACTSATSNALAAWLKRLIERDDFEERMQDLCGDEWETIRKEIEDFVPSEAVTSVILEHLGNQRSPADSLMADWLQERVSTGEVVIRLLRGTD